LAVIAYTSFYYSYIPVRGISVPVYLQFDHGTAPGILVPNSERRSGQESQKWPHGIAPIDGLVTRQKYDISVEMRVPRSRTNLNAGNWMLDLSLRCPTSSNSIKNMLGWDDDTAPSNKADTPTQTQALANSRRPAILTYRSWPIEHLHRLLRLPLYLTGFGSESETLQISMLESAYFRDTAPSSLRLELRSRTPLEVYGVKVHVVARLEGLRWAMYTHRVASAAVFVGLFWATEMGVLLLTWGVITMLFSSSSSSPEEEEAREAAQRSTQLRKIKTESDDDAKFSDTDRTFPTLPSQAPLRYSSPKGKPKTEEQEQILHDIPPRDDAEADDEDDDFVREYALPRSRDSQVGFTDSGLGTGVDSERERERERVRRRGRAKEEAR
jgi:seipin